MLKAYKVFAVKPCLTASVNSGGTPIKALPRRQKKKNCFVLINLKSRHQGVTHALPQI
jgi:hypothetical protein